jgi:zinc transporter ZupT
MRRNEESTMLEKIRKTISVTVLALSIYGLFSDNNDLIPFIMAGLAVLMVVMGIEEYQKDRKSYRGYLLFAVFVFMLFVFIQVLIY